MRITKADYEDFQRLRKWEKKTRVRDSAKLIENLEDDIDLPIRKCVALLALLGCKPLYSCCGFDYDGQPFHKSHQYGIPYIKLLADNPAFSFVYNLTRIGTPWFCKTSRGVVDVLCEIKGNPHWRAEECIHFAEECIFVIDWMEKYLVSFKTAMMEEVVLEDSNKRALEIHKNWQYPSKSPWKILKSDYFTEEQSQA